MSDKHIFSRPLRAATGGVASSFLQLVAARSARRGRRPVLAVTPSVPPPFNRSYLRELRAAELQSWQASGGDAWIPNTGTFPASNRPAAENAVTKVLPSHSPLGAPPQPAEGFDA